MALMAIIAIYRPISPRGGFIVSEQFPVQRVCHPVLGDLVFTSVSGMPRLRGRPRRGAGWYAAASRRKRHREFQAAVTLARRRRRRNILAADSPPGTIVQEDSSAQLPPDFSEMKMVTFPDDWDPLTHSFRFGITSRGRTSFDSCATAPSDPGTETCFIEEEQWKNAEEEQRKNTGAATDTGCLGRDDMHARPPSPPPLLPEQLQLIFEVRGLVEDQIYRAVCTSQRLDMLFAAYSTDSPKHLCPTCAQPFAIPVRATAAQDDNASTG
jgi:hypothetical protein